MLCWVDEVDGISSLHMPIIQAMAKDSLSFAHLCAPMVDAETNRAGRVMELALEVRGLSKSYRVNTDEGEKTIDALKDIDLTVERGSCLGIVGRNGCGKTTLLRIIGGLVKPTTGSVTVHGSLLAITDVGGGFVPDLTGLENIRLNARMYGLSEAETDRILPLIAQFSEIEDFFHVPVKSYSQGMFLRLAFSTMIHLPVDIVLLDEVLAVGDVAFRAKCFNKLRELSADGLTVLMVSHTYDEIAAFCNRCLVMDHGMVVVLGPPDETFPFYQTASRDMSTVNENDTAHISDHFHYLRPDFVQIEAVTIGAKGAPGARISVNSPVEIGIQWKKLIKGHEVAFHLSIADEMGRASVDTANFYGKPANVIEQGQSDRDGVFIDTCIIPEKLLNTGVFRLKISVTVYRTVRDYFTVLETVKDFTFILFDEMSDGDRLFWTYSPAPIRTPFHWNRS
ncbi:MAG: ABC transporter ATP-binding protein [Flavobacteriales bacterium]|nr:ABC transporter ATP-binding protein [Flavobacteriales bacterium]